MAGLWIRKTGAKHPGFWYPMSSEPGPRGQVPQKDQFIRETLQSHCFHWGREIVRIDGEDVHRDVPASAWSAWWGDKLTVQNGEMVVTNGEKVEIGKYVQG